LNTYAYGESQRMKFETEIISDTLVVRVQNTTFDVRGVKAFKRDIFLAIAESDFKNIVINMENVRMVDSTGLGGLLFAKRQATIKGGECYLVSPQQKILSLIKISKLEEVFNIVDTEDAVVKKTPKPKSKKKS
jgi:anti-sigma B factor antagonist